MRWEQAETGDYLAEEEHRAMELSISSVLNDSAIGAK
jgi:hypothetical protein